MSFNQKYLTLLCVLLGLVTWTFASSSPAAASPDASSSSPSAPPSSQPNNQRKDGERSVLSDRLGVLTVDLGNGPVSLPQFDANTLTAAVINIIIFGGVVWFLLAVVFPLFGFKLCYLLGTCDPGYVDQYGAYDTSGYGQPAAGAAGYYQKRYSYQRSLEVLGPVLKALSTAYNKYEQTPVAAAAAKLE